MKLIIKRDRMKIVPEDSIFDERDTAFIEEVLGMKKTGDSIKLIRSSFGWLETESQYDEPG